MTSLPERGEVWWCELGEPGEDPIPRRSGVNLDSVASVAVGALAERLGRLSGDRMDDMCRALQVAVDCRL